MRLAHGVTYRFLPLALLVFALAGWTVNASVTLVYGLIYMSIVLLPLAWRGKTRRPLDPFEPYFGLSLLFLLYSISTVQIVEERDVTYYNEAVPPSALFEYVVACLLGQLGLALGYIAGLKRHQTGIGCYQTENRGTGRLEERIRVLLGPALLISLLMSPFYIDRFNFLDVVSYADAAFESRTMRMEDAAAGVADLLLREPYVILVLCASTVMLFDSRRKWLRVPAIVILGTYLLTNLLSGWRGQLVLGALLPIIYFHYRVHRLSTIPIIAGGLFVYLLINALSVVRFTTDLSVMWMLLNENIVDTGLAFLRLSGSGELATSSNLLRLIIGFENGETDFYWGWHALSQLGAFVPRLFWPERPPLGNELFVQLFYPGVYEAGGGYGLFFHQEGYWDFGLPGVVLYAFILSYMTRWIYWSLVVKRGEAFWILLYAVLYGHLVLSVVRTGFVGSLKAAMMAALPLLIIAWLGDKERAPKRARRTG